MRTINATEHSKQSGQTDPAMLRLLGHRYGDGLVYFGDTAERRVYHLAIRLGLVSTEGYLTPEGRSLLARNAKE
ncbi:MAG: hypothetical protein ACE5E5_16770 [Phycisphaerae bacterium]